MSTEKCKKILVTGATGFVGRAVIAALQYKENMEIHIVTRNLTDSKSDTGIFCHQADILDAKQTNEVLEDVRPDFLIHLAWNVTPGEYLQSTENLAWSAATINLCRQFYQLGGQKAFFCGTCFEYDFTDSPCSVKTTAIHPVSLYAECKADTFEAVRKYCEAGNYEYVWGRLFFLYGEGEDSRRVIPYIIGNLLENKKVVCKNGSAVRDYLYVKDAGRLIVETLFSNYSGAKNIASGCPVTMEEIFNTFAKVCGREELVQIEDQPVVPQKVVALVDGEYNVTSLAEGARYTVEWWKSVKGGKYAR